MNMLDVVGQLADMKTIDYRNTLAISTIIELLVEKGVISREEFARKAMELEGESMAEIIVKRRMKK